MASWSEEQRHRGMRDAFARAESTCPEMVHETTYVFGGRPVRMRIVGHRLAERLALPFAHLRCRPGAPSDGAITIDLWDAVETGTAPGIDVLPDPLGLTSSYFLSEDERSVTSVLQHSISSFDRQEQRILGVAFDADRLSLYEIGRPLHVPLSLWYSDRDLPLVHTALVSYQGKGVLLVGESGDGKTTTSLACLTAGFQYLADDLAGLEILSDGGVRGHSMYGSAFIDDDTLVRFPALRAHALPGKYGYEDKKLVLISEFAPTQLLGTVSIDAIVLLRISDQDRTRVRPATKGEALLAMARGALQIGVLSPGRRGFELLGELADRVQAFWVDLGADSNDISRCVCDLIPRDVGVPGRGST